MQYFQYLARLPTYILSASRCGGWVRAAQDQREESTSHIHTQEGFHTLWAFQCIWVRTLFPYPVGMPMYMGRTLFLIRNSSTLVVCLLMVPVCLRKCFNSLSHHMPMLVRHLLCLCACASASMSTHCLSRPPCWSGTCYAYLSLTLFHETTAMSPCLCVVCYHRTILAPDFAKSFTC